MTSSHRSHTGHELSHSRAHEGRRTQQDHDKGGHQGGHDKGGQDKLPSPIDVQKALKGVEYPATKADLLRCARDGHADARIVDGLLRMPDREYASPASVSKELGKPR
ncbi:DUF2795 domain-containing protein [Burkholderia glumae]|uniref:DUF2795 domain-containing protein n=1 Tax=Burkholderia glumae TaxID=337 RepID=A0AAP9Y3U2_BURGL|nr:DUF2795 domain-containing protein [Burkholderia glumae]ACR30542.1 Hypothetical protein bglu_2g00460 [Burkholderia glumae BGR1]AJY62746.1 hypothetical protein KS03_3591 [Burkholderia glumae LMG 2196 = ATCC 33617]KHJ61760.1 hypothetical protein NCPPB3923_17050 [Burkholderia glumae]MCM2484168.1 DUF2795 domain-containing protein [Burkholderia glumae]MCM2494510.1 DUF2795 domain-containing protein [Burkholderia glumae]